MPTDAASAFSSSPLPDPSHRVAFADTKVDVLILTALEDELTAVLALGGVWEEAHDLAGFPYHRRVFGDRPAGKPPLVAAAAWLGRMGELGVTLRGSDLLRELDPACVAMCGICAGKRGDVALGDVIVADRLYSYDHGKIIAAPGKPVELRHDIETFNLHPLWKMGATGLKREIDLLSLQARRPPSKEAQRRWLLHRLYEHEVEGGPAPVGLPDRKKRCPGWSKRIEEARSASLLELEAGKLALTQKGRDHVLDERTLYPDELPEDPPLKVVVGAIATGKTVQEDPELFPRLQRLVRGTVGVEMEGAAVGELARYFEKRGIVVKAVSDHADLQKDDSFRTFACVASAQVLLAFLLRYLDPAPRAAARPAKDAVDERDRRELHGAESRDGFAARVERVALLRDPGASVTRRRAPAPFAGVLEVAVREGSVPELRVVGALDQPITEALFWRYVMEVERPFRQSSAFLRSKLIHTGPEAPPELLRLAADRGVLLETFDQYQGLIDFTRYLAWQTGRLESDPVYPPGLYVDQPARVSLAGGREEQGVEDALGTLSTLLDEPQHPRFALVLGEFGAGKTFLLHELARRMASRGERLVPVLVEMRKLEKQRSLRALLAQHFAMADMGRIDLDAFQYMLSEGRIALLFDGFDELAQRVTYDRAVEHFETVLEAAKGRAKVVLTSRTQHFLTDHQVRRALAERAEQVPGYRLFTLEAFGEKQIRRFLLNATGKEEDAEERYRLLDEVKDLLGLSHNPRMLGFIAQVPPEELRAAREGGGEITAAKLYELLVGRWLDFEHTRANPPGSPRGISREKLREAMTEVALMLWRRPEKLLEIGELPESLVAAVQAAGAPPVERGVVEHLIGSGSLLVRDGEGRFSFVHRSVMEWLVAEAAAREVVQSGEAVACGIDEMSDLMADFFVSMAGKAHAEDWARRRALRAQGMPARNAARVLKRLGTAMPVDLSGRDLHGQDLAGADLRWANLARADLHGATLAGARLRGASLVGARLDRADLREADLTEADLEGADLAFARLQGADLGGARGLAADQLHSTKLVGARGVEVEGLAGAGAAPPVPGEAGPAWWWAFECNAVAWSSSGGLVASGHADGSIRIWDAASGQPIRVMASHSGAVRSVAFSPDGKTLASGAEDATVQLWEVASGTSLHAFKGHDARVQSVAFSPDGKMLASGALDMTVRLWGVASGASLRTFEGPAHGVLCVAFSPDGKTLASGSYDATVRLWEVASGTPLHTFEGHMNGVLSVAFSPDGKTFASGYHDSTVRLWEIASGNSLRSFERDGSRVHCVAFSPDGKTLASGSDSGTMQMWEVASGVSLRAFQGHARRVHCVAFSPDGKTLASGSHDGTVRLWDVPSGTSLRAFEGNENWVQSVAFSPDGTALACGSGDAIVRLWDIRAGTLLRAFAGHTNIVRSVAFSPDGKSLASGSHDVVVRIWDIASGSLLQSCTGHYGRVTSVAFSSDGEVLASGSSDNIIRLWEVATGYCIGTCDEHVRSVLSVAFSPDGKMLASGSDDATVRLWEVSSGTSLRAFEGHEKGVLSVAFSPDGKTLASGADDASVRLWGVSSGSSLRVFDGHELPVRSVAFGPDGKTLASGADDASVRLWEVSSGVSLRVFEGHKKGVLSVAFSPDGKTLASGSSDNTLRLWDIATGRCLAILLATAEGWAAFTPDGRYKVGGDVAGSFWHVIGLCRFEPGELDPYLPGLRLPDDASFLTIPDPAPRAR